jgi:hypothetical protein
MTDARAQGDWTRGDWTAVVRADAGGERRADDVTIKDNSIVDERCARTIVRSRR